MSYKHYFSLCSILKDEDLYFLEWLTYHSLLGVEHFYLYDNGSAHPVAEHSIIQRYMEQGKVTVVDFPGTAMQYPAYNDCLNRFGNQTFWLGFIDLDEFITMRKGKDIRPLLAEYETYASLALNWMCFSSSGYLSRPKGLVTAIYTQALAPLENTVNLHIKSIVQPARTEKVGTPHAFHLKPNEWAVDENRNTVHSGWSFSPCSYRRLWLNHYLYKSQQDWEVKRQKQRADIGEQTSRTEELFYQQAAAPYQEEHSAARFAPNVSEWLAKGVLPDNVNVTSCPQEDSGHLDSYLHTAARLHTEKQTERAEILLCHAALRHNGDAKLWIMRAYLARMSRKFDAAELFLNHAIRLENNAAAFEEYMDLRIAQQRYRDAWSILLMIKEFTLRNPDSPINKKNIIAERYLKSVLAQ